MRETVQDLARGRHVAGRARRRKLSSRLALGANSSTSIDDIELLAARLPPLPAQRRRPPGFPSPREASPKNPGCLAENEVTTAE
jgi:hypothetical protein